MKEAGKPQAIDQYGESQAVYLEGLLVWLIQGAAPVSSMCQGHLASTSFVAFWRHKDNRCHVEIV